MRAVLSTDFPDKLSGGKDVTLFLAARKATTPTPPTHPRSHAALAHERAEVPLVGSPGPRRLLDDSILSAAVERVFSEVASHMSGDAQLSSVYGVRLCAGFPDR